MSWSEAAHAVLSVSMAALHGANAIELQLDAWPAEDASAAEVRRWIAAGR